MVRRIAAYRKPFTVGQKERGYKDFLIWQNVLAIAREGGDPIAFVTANSGDFAAHDRTLHPDLMMDLTAVGMGPDRVVLFSDLHSCVVHVIAPDLQLAASIRAALEGDQIDGADMRRELRRVVEAELVSLQIPRHVVGFPDGVENVIVTAIEDVPTVAVDGVRRLSSGEFLVTARVEATCKILFYADRSVWPRITHQRMQLFEDYWQDPSVIAGSTETIGAMLDATWEPTTRTITSAALTLRKSV